MTTALPPNVVLTAEEGAGATTAEAVTAAQEIAPATTTRPILARKIPTSCYGSPDQVPDLGLDNPDIPVLNTGDPLGDTLSNIIGQYPGCAALFGGAANALSLIDNTDFQNIDNNPGPPAEAVKYITSNTQANRGATYMISYPNQGTTYYSQAGVDTVGQDAANTLYFHELQHQNGAGAEIDGPNMRANMQQISRECHTGGAAAPPQNVP
jgi:hypothetical protein